MVDFLISEIFKYVVFYLSYLILLLFVIIVTSEQYYCFVLLYHCEFEI